MRGILARLVDALTGRTQAAPAPAPGAEPATAEAAAAPVFDPLAPDFVADPHPTLAALRERDPVHRSPMGAYVLTRYDDVVRALADPRLGNAPARHAVVHQRNRHRYVCADVANNILPFLDPPRHAVERRLVAAAFGEQLRRRPPDVAEIAASLLDAHQGDGMDLLADFASPLAVTAVAQLLGVPPPLARQLEQHSEHFFRLFTAIPSAAVRDELDHALLACRTAFDGLIAERRRQPTDDLLSALLQASDDLADLPPQWLADTCMLLFADGVENVDRGLANAVYALLRHPDQMARLRAQPGLLPGAVEECLRYESPAMYIARIAREPLELGGVRIGPDAVVLLVLGAANRDPRQFAQPDRLDIARSPNPHLGFGRGRHACIGGPLVATLLRGALQALFSRWPELSLAEPTVRWLPRPGHRWIEHLPVRLRA